MIAIGPVNPQLKRPIVLGGPGSPRPLCHSLDGSIEFEPFKILDHLIIGTGIAVDKMLALTGQLPSVQIANVMLPTPAEDAERRAIDAKLDEITALLREPRPDAAQTREGAV